MSGPGRARTIGSNAPTEEDPMTAPDTAGPDLANRRRFTVAAFRATRRYPGPARPRGGTRTPPPPPPGPARQPRPPSGGASSPPPRRYPGPAGTVLARELLAWADFGYRLGADRPLMALVDDLLETQDAAAA